MPSNLFVVLMGMGTVFFGLICIIILSTIMSKVLGGKSTAAAPAPAAAQPANPNAVRELYVDDRSF